ncbi:MAG TPA: FtsX-like permease family protein [Streptosporangiaceae bacterium]|nr:FtsX-like permease family protein [Streptosporangiaceae bacterium]
MAPVWLTLRADLRQRWRSMLGLALLIGLVSGVVLTAAAGARRTSTAYPRMLRWASAAQLDLVPGQARAGLTGTGQTGYFAALARLPQVAAMSPVDLLGMAILVPHGPPDSNVNTAGSLDAAVGRAADRVRVLAGRAYDPADPDAVMIDQQMAALAHVRPGGLLRVQAIEGYTSAHPVVRGVLTARVSGIVRFDDGLVPASAGAAEPRALFSPAFVTRYVTHRDPWLVESDYAGVRLRPGASQAAFTAAARSLARRYPATRGTVDIVSLAGAAAAAQRAIRPEAVALAIFTGLAGLIALVILAQLLSRQVSIDAADYPVLRALGAGRGTLAAGSLLWVGAVTMAGGLLGVGIAIAASPLMPIGLARLAEPSPGVEVNLAVLGAGLAATVLLPLLLVLPAIWRAARTAGPHGVAAAPGRGLAARLGPALGTAGSLTGGIGVRMALEPGHGRTAVPVRSALAGTAVAVAAVVGAAVFGASLLGLVAIPHRYGQNWTQSIDFEAPTTPRSLAAQLIATQPLVSGYALGNFGQIAVNRQVVPAIGVDPVHGQGFVTVLAGRRPAGPGEIALGQQTFRAAHAAIGQPVRASVNGRTRRLRVVGEVVLPAFTEGGSSATDLGQGALVGTSLLSTPYLPTGCVHGLTCYSFILLRYPAGTPLRAADAHLAAVFAQHRCRISQGCYTLTTDQRPSDIRNYSGIRDTPLVLGALLGVVAVGTLSHALLAGVRRRYRDLALLKTLGLVRSQLLRVVCWQATALAAVALLAGLPLGLLAGRWAWAVFAASAGVAGQADVPVALVLLAIPATVALANLIAAGPGWTAARVPAGTVLRSE